jgi:two-component sensor histidine kinase
MVIEPAGQSADQSRPACFVFPALMWVANLLVASVAAEALVIRHVRSLRQSITTFARGNREVLALRFEGAASELRDVSDAYEAMTVAILHDEADLENIIHRKEVLLREVHHRVKNNLQLIASILNMQVRSARAPETREAMRNVQERVMSLATIHRELYQTSGLIDVRADELFPQIVGQIMRIGAAPTQMFQVTPAIDLIRLTPDQAVPLALFLTEDMANVMKHGMSAPDETVQVGVTLAFDTGGRARLSLTNGLPKPGGARTNAGTAAASDGFGSQLMAAFTEQLDGQMHRLIDGDTHTLPLTFPLRPLSEAEERTTSPGWVTGHEHLPVKVQESVASLGHSC